MLAALLAGVFGSQPLWKARSASQPSFQQITFRGGVIARARFAPDGQIVYHASGAAVTGGKPFELFSIRPGTPEPRSLHLPPAGIASISASGELAILDPRFTLATVPLAGGAPRELLEDVRGADWAPDGKGLAVVHASGFRSQLEFPIGKVLYQAPEGRWIGWMQFSPSGDRIAFAVGGSAGLADLMVVDLNGKSQKIVQIPFELRWSPSGDEIWFNVIEEGTTSFWGVSLTGRKRLITSFPGDFVLQDIARDGRLLLERGIEQKEVVGRFAGDSAERNLSWLDGSVPAALSGDGRVLLFTETRQGGGPNRAVYKRRTDGSDAVRLGEGTALALSPDGLWALASPGSTASHLVLLPTGPGQPRIVSLSKIRLVGSRAAFFPDGNRILIRGVEVGLQVRLYVLEIESGNLRAVTQEVTPFTKESAISVSPDGKSVFSSNSLGETTVFDVDKGSPRAVPGLTRGLEALGWCADGSCLFVQKTGTNPVKVYRLDLSSGRLDPWREFSVTDVGAGAVKVIPTPDGESYVYGYTRHSSDLFIAEGLK
jgi:Tol biopolymer transport system component